MGGKEGGEDQSNPGFVLKVKQTGSTETEHGVWGKQE